jgi:hypothetical protein
MLWCCGIETVTVTRMKSLAVRSGRTGSALFVMVTDRGVRPAVAGVDHVSVVLPSAPLVSVYPLVIVDRVVSRSVRRIQAATSRRCRCRRAGPSAWREISSMSSLRPGRGAVVMFPRMSRLLVGRRQRPGDADHRDGQHDEPRSSDLRQRIGASVPCGLVILVRGPTGVAPRGVGDDSRTVSGLYIQP